MSRALVVYVALTALTLGVFAIWPISISMVAHYFYDGEGFVGRDSLERFGRDFFRVTPFVVLAAFAALWLAKRRGVALRWAPSGRAVIFLIATIAIGPGLIVNLGLKDHWRRPRPTQTQEFNGPSPFRPWYETNGDCKKNCSFVRGEASTGFWMVAPASAAAAVARSRDRRGLLVRRRREPAQARLRRPLSVRCPFRRADKLHRHRGRAAACLADEEAP